MSYVTTYSLFAAGSTATSAATPHNLYGGTYTGLSAIPSDYGVRIVLASSNSPFRIQTGGSAPPGTPIGFGGIYLAASPAISTLPDLLASDASQLHVIRALAENSVVYWQIWLRSPV